MRIIDRLFFHVLVLKYLLLVIHVSLVCVCVCVFCRDSVFKFREYFIPVFLFNNIVIVTKLSVDVVLAW